MTDYIISEEHISSIERRLGIILSMPRSRTLAVELKTERERVYKILETKCVEYHGAPVIHFSDIEDMFLRGEP